MAADLDSLRWKIYIATERSPERIERVLRIVADHFQEKGWIYAALYLAPRLSPPASKTMKSKSVPATGDPDEFFNKKLTVCADNIDAEQP
jgi:hypothetical protein